MQAVLKRDSVGDDIMLSEDVLRLTERPNANAPAGPRLTEATAEHSATSLARRFAPDPVRMRASRADPTVIQPSTQAPRSAFRRARRLLVRLAVFVLAAALIAVGLLWLNASKGVSLDSAFEDLGLVPARIASSQASADLFIPVRPRHAEPMVLAFKGSTAGGDPVAGGDQMVRTAARSDVAPSPTAGFVVRSGEADRIDGLMVQGRKMIDEGYLAGARAYYTRAAEAGSGEAALAVGATYDPEIVAKLGVQGVKPDAAEAAKWYARAASLGIANRATALGALAQDWATEGPQATEIAAASSTPIRKPHAKQAKTEAAKPKPGPKPQRVAANITTERINVKPHLLASEVEPQPGPLSRLVKAAASLSAQEEWMEVASPVNLRKGPSSNAGTYKVAQKGAKLRVVGRAGNWVKVADPKTNVEGYVYKRFLKESSAP